MMYFQRDSGLDTCPKFPNNYKKEKDKIPGHKDRKIWQVKNYEDVLREQDRYMWLDDSRQYKGKNFS